MPIVRRASEPAVALETTLLVHGVPKEAAPTLSGDLSRIVREPGAVPALVGVVSGVPTVGMTDDELALLLRSGSVPKANASNLGAMIRAGGHAATTVSATMELASAAGLRVFATGGLGGVHPASSGRFDVSADLVAFTRFPVAVVTSGVKSLLDVGATREALETLGVPVVGYRTDDFPAFYQRKAAGPVGPVDARFDDAASLAGFVAFEIARTGRGVVVANPIPEAEELDADAWSGWLAQAERDAERAGVTARGVTPFLLARVHELSGGATLRANLALVKDNARLAAQLAVEMFRRI